MKNSKSIAHLLFDSIRKSGLFIFFRELFHHPRRMGAALPSSAKLGNVLAAQIPLDGPGYIVELGGGTGSITDVLLKTGVAPERLIVIERSYKLADHLKQRFPQVTVLRGDASHLTMLLDQNIVQNVDVIVSGLPLRIFADVKIKSICKELLATLRPGGILLQFTYSWRKHYPYLSQSFKLIKSEYVFFNIPPARVDIFEMKNER